MMLHEYVKAAGCGSTKEFYSKFKTPEDFFSTYPLYKPNGQLNVEQNQSLPGDHSVENSLKNVTETFKRGGTNRKAPANSTIIPVGPNPEMKKGGNYTWDASTNSSYELGGEIEEYKSGGIHINPANKGKFNATKKATGKTTEELTHSKNPVTRKRAIFAQNAAKWHHEMGGMIPKFQDGNWDNQSKIPQDVINGYKIDNSWQGLMKDRVAQQQMKPQQNLPGVTPDLPTNQPQFNPEQDFSQNDMYNTQRSNTGANFINTASHFANYGIPAIQSFEDTLQNKSRRTTNINNRMTDTMYADPTNPQNSKGDYGIGANNGIFRPNQYTPGRFGQYGGKFQQGGQNQPIYVQDNNDPRLQSYNDSLGAYNTGNNFTRLNDLYGQKGTYYDKPHESVNRTHKPGMSFGEENLPENYYSAKGLPIADISRYYNQQDGPGYRQLYDNNLTGTMGSVDEGMKEVKKWSHAFDKYKTQPESVKVVPDKEAYLFLPQYKKPVQPYLLDNSIQNKIDTSKTTFKNGGKFQEGGVYDASSDEIAALKAKGYKIQIL